MKSIFKKAAHKILFIFFLPVLLILWIIGKFTIPVPARNNQKGGVA